MNQDPGLLRQECRELLALAASEESAGNLAICGYRRVWIKSGDLPLYMRSYADDAYLYVRELAFKAAGSTIYQKCRKMLDNIE